MIEAYQQQLIKYYKGYLRDIISGKPFSAVVLRGEKNKPTTTVELHRAIALFQKNEKTAQRRGWTIAWEDWSSKKLGKQKWVSTIIVDTEEDYLHLLQKEEEAAAFKHQLQILLDWQPAIQSFLMDKPERVLDLKIVWSGLQKVVDHLLAHDVSNHYIRSIPVPVHTKFIEAYRPVIFSLLKAIAPEKYTVDSTTLDELLLLKQKPHLYPIRWLDKTIAEQFMHGMEITGVTVDWLKQINWDIKEVWLVENETNLYLIPERKNAIAIFSKGKATHSLKDVPLLAKAQLFYWGDLDEEGYKMLNAMHGYYPHNLQSVFMDETTLLRHAGEMGKQDAVYKTVSLEYLTREEQAAFNILKYHNGRLEQERIRQDYVVEVLGKIS
ncbi:MAG: hypothetical protein J0H29_07730 [Sphingobacteriales bacterium]|nr:hypothetical protein [Sphingobacteriales bacterium]OJY87623.1 MAG: hypothetical protein BGP14_12990 [Sphingobacteriales bacterium 44-15]